jgi:ABC-type Mn2+/Zn2+ transport system ATPase subunit
VTDTGLIDLSSVSAGYGRTTVLHDVNLSIDSTAFSGIVGPSGAGKTTLLRVLLGLIKPSAGSRTTAPGLRVAYVPQLETVDWKFPVTVFECVLMARTEHRFWPWPSAQERQAVAAVLDRLGIADLADRHIRELSGGQQQRMFLARALLREPQVLLLDEPTSGVDINTRHDVLHLLGDLHDDGMTSTGWQRTSPTSSASTVMSWPRGRRATSSSRACSRRPSERASKCSSTSACRSW